MALARKEGTKVTSEMMAKATAKIAAGAEHKVTQELIEEGVQKAFTTLGKHKMLETGEKKLLDKAMSGATKA